MSTSSESDTLPDARTRQTTHNSYLSGSPRLAGDECSDNVQRLLWGARGSGRLPESGDAWTEGWGNCPGGEREEGSPRQRDAQAEVQRCENSAVWEYHVWGVGGRNRDGNKALPRNWDLTLRAGGSHWKNPKIPRWSDLHSRRLFLRQCRKWIGETRML